MPTTSALLNQLINDQWEAWMKYDPLFATYVGDHRYNDRLPSTTEEAYQAWRNQLVDFRTRLGDISTEGNSQTDQLNNELFRHLLDDEIAELDFHAYRLPISRCAGYHTLLPDMFQLMPFEQVHDYEVYITRLNAFRLYNAQNIDLMREGLRTGYLPPRCTLTNIDKQLKAQIVAEPQKSAFYQPFLHFPAHISKVEQNRLLTAAEKALMNSVVPAYRDLLHFIEHEYLPAAREGIACADLPDGEAFYAHRIHYYTSLNLNAQEVHQIGLDEVKRIRAEMEGVINVTDWHGDMSEFLEFLRTDPQFYVNTPQALLEKTALVLKRMDGE
jgi:uncharacterized protein (DUF885 family)